MTVYAVGDIHGQLDALRAAWDRIAADKAREGTNGANVVHVGDYADRGPDVPGVLDALIAAQASGEAVVFLAGNHDHMMLGFVDPEFELDEISARYDWADPRLGGRATLEAYGVKTGLPRTQASIRRAAQEAVPADHVKFLRNLPLSHSEGGCLFVHAGIRPGVPLTRQRREDLVWIRSDFLDDPTDHGPLVIHGHTPVRRIDHAGNRVNIDTGAGFGRPLSAVAIEGREIFELTDRGRELVSPPAGPDARR